MNIDQYTFEEFKHLAERFHGYAAPGLLLGGYMVALAKSRLPEGTLFEAISETRKCLPDAVQLLSLCSMGNNWLKVRDLGRYAVTLYDKYTGRGVRVSIALDRLRAWPEYYSWLMKLKPKKEQDEEQLLREIEEAGDSICVVTDVTVDAALLGHKHSCGIAVCPRCGEGYPEDDGPICRGCQGEDYFMADAEYGRMPGDEAGTAAPTGPIPGNDAPHAPGAPAAHDGTTPASASSSDSPAAVPGASSAPASPAPGIRVIVTWDGHVDEMNLDQLLPHGFGPKSLE